MSDLFFNENVTIHMGHVPMGCTIGHALMRLGYVPCNFMVTYPKIFVMIGDICDISRPFGTCKYWVLTYDIGTYTKLSGHVPNLYKFGIC